MNEFRERLLSGRPLRDPLLREKGGKPESTHADGLPDCTASLDGFSIPRTATRLTDHRNGDRHRLLRDEEAVASWKERDFRVSIINLSGGGAMLGVPFQPMLWDRVDLSLGGCGTLESVVRWIRKDRIGVEFAHETRIEAEPDLRNSLLREVIRRSFPDVEIKSPATAQKQEAADTAAGSAESVEPESVQRGDRRHPLIWTGLIHFNHESTPVRLRNVSESGALVESDGAFPVGADLLLDLEDAGTVFCTVAWARGDQYGLRFQDPFNLAMLARSKPTVAASGWTKPDYLRDENSDTSPWASRWNRLTLGELRHTLSR